MNEGDYLDQRLERQQESIPKQDNGDNKDASVAKMVQEKFQSSVTNNLQTKENERYTLENQRIQMEKELKKQKEESKRLIQKEQRTKETEDILREKEQELQKLKEKLENNTLKKEKRIQNAAEEEENCERQIKLKDAKQISSQNKDLDGPITNLKESFLSFSQKNNIGRKNGSESSVSGTLTIPDRLKKIESLLIQILENQQTLDERLERLENQQNKIIDSQRNQEISIEKKKNNCIG